MQCQLATVCAIRMANHPQKKRTLIYAMLLCAVDATIADDELMMCRMLQHWLCGGASLDAPAF
jgi:hypothetical protein